MIPLHECSRDKMPCYLIFLILIIVKLIPYYRPVTKKCQQTHLGRRVQSNSADYFTGIQFVSRFLSSLIKSLITFHHNTFFFPTNHCCLSAALIVCQHTGLLNHNSQNKDYY